MRIFGFILLGLAVLIAALIHGTLPGVTQGGDSVVGDFWFPAAVALVGAGLVFAGRKPRTRKYRG